MKEFIQTLKELDFKYIPQEGCEAWSKVYKGFILFIVKAPNDKLLASITVRQLEIIYRCFNIAKFIPPYTFKVIRSVCYYRSAHIKLGFINFSICSLCVFTANSCNLLLSYRDWETDLIKIGRAHV